MMNAGPFDAMIQAFMHAAQSMGSQTGGRFQNLGFQNKAFRSRVPIIVGKQAFNQPAVDGEQPAAEDTENEDKEDEDEEDEDVLEKLETELAIATKKEAQIRKAKQLADKKQKAEEEYTASALSKKPAAAGGKTAKAKAEGKGKAAGGKGKGKAAGKGKSAAPKANAKAAAPAGAKPPGKFDIAGWLATNVKRAEPKRSSKGVTRWRSGWLTRGRAREAVAGWPKRSNRRTYKESQGGRWRNA